MAPKIFDLTESKGILNFTLKDVDVSIANGLRRTAISDIDTVVFRTSRYENKEDDSEFIINSTRFNNEILKQRLSCIPIYITDIEGFPYEQYILECNVKNDTDGIIYVTTRDFRIKNILTGEYIPDEQKEKIFPRNDFTNEYIKFCRLRPRISDEIDGEEVKFTCKFSLGNCKENSMFNVTSMCVYGNTRDIIKINEAWDRKEEQYVSENLSKEEILFNKNNWLAVDAKRIYEANSYDFKIKTIGVFTNKHIMKTACNVIINKFVKLKEHISEISILKADLINENGFDICLDNEGFTIGKILESVLYNRFFEKEKKILFVGFKKNHPHDNYSFVRVVMNTKEGIDELRIILQKSFDDVITIYSEIKEQF
uniref:DNA-directed RNA polymerase RpoA/D/Rpb3-type domain-containing protein n=1 Tax=viral metagenome TaxID=1070528 RepID=A0A6C0BUP1_9ZZZZ